MLDFLINEFTISSTGLSLIAKGDSSGGGAGGVVLAVGVVLFIYWLFKSDDRGKGKHKGKKK